eukprot:6667869-Prymnesium_polylepis.1
MGRSAGGLVLAPSAGAVIAVRELSLSLSRPAATPHTLRRTGLAESVSRSSSEMVLMLQPLTRTRILSGSRMNTCPRPPLAGPPITSTVPRRWMCHSLSGTFSTAFTHLGVRVEPLPTGVEAGVAVGLWRRTARAQPSRA